MHGIERDISAFGARVREKDLTKEIDEITEPIGSSLLVVKCGGENT